MIGEVADSAGQEAKQRYKRLGPSDMGFACASGGGGACTTINTPDKPIVPT
jgi:hypothetical protein